MRCAQLGRPPSHPPCRWARASCSVWFSNCKLRIAAGDGEAQQRGDGLGQVRRSRSSPEAAPGLVDSASARISSACGATLMLSSGRVPSMARSWPMVWATASGVGAPGENLELFQAQTEQADGQRLGDGAGAAVLVDLEVVEVVPVVDDQEVGLLLRRSERIGPGAGAAAEHLPELDLAEDRLGEDEVADGGNVDAGVEHVHGDGDAGEVLVLEIVEGLLGALHLAVDDLGEAAALEVRVEAVEALVELQGVAVADGEDDGLGGQGADGVLDRSGP